MTTYQDDKALLEDVLGGEERAVRHLFDRYYPALRYFAAGIIANTQEAEDIAIGVFQRFLERKAGFNSMEAVRSFLFTAVKNASVDSLRREHTRLRHVQEVSHLGLSPDDLAEEKMLEAKVLQLVQEEVERLPAQSATVFKAYFFEGKDTSTIARELNLSSQTVLNHKARAVQHLRAFVKKQGIFPIVFSLLPDLFK